MQTTVLLPNMSGKTDFVGNPVKTVGYDSHKTNKRLSTIVVHSTNFTGRIWLEGSLKTEPKEDLDWFTIPLTSETPYLEYSNFSPVLIKRQADYQTGPHECQLGKRYGCLLYCAQCITSKQSGCAVYLCFFE